MKRFIAAVMPHLCLISGGMLLVFYVIDNFFNSYMGFMNHPYTNYVIAVFAVTGIISSIMLIAAHRREIRRINRRIDRELKKQARR